MKFPDAERFHHSHEPTVRAPGGTPMVAPAVQGINLFKIAGRSISGWIPSLKAGTDSPLRQPFCSQLEERLLLYLECGAVRYADGTPSAPK